MLFNMLGIKENNGKSLRRETSYRAPFFVQQETPETCDVNPCDFTPKTFPGWRLRDIQRWSALIQNTFRSVSALFITWKSLNSADSALNSAENGNFQS